MYITKDDMKSVIASMQRFETSLENLFGEFSYDLRDNIGRRNMLLSAVQERETARVLSKRYSKVIADGAPGKPDVVIEDIGKELECKLTSGSRSNGTVSYSLQTDYATIKNKGRLDYLYIIANEEFNEFCVLFFEGLTSDDFFPPAKASRGKSRMKKESAMMKAHPLIGSIINNAQESIDSINEEIMKKIIEKDKRIDELNKRLDSTSLKAEKKREDLQRIILNENNRYDKSIEKLSKRREYWLDNSSYSFVFERFERSNKSKSILERVKNLFLRSKKWPA